MQIGIKGIDYIYLWNVKRNKQNKIFFRFRNQIYKVYPSELRRLRINKYGENAGTDAIIMYKEDAIQPYHGRGMNYTQDATLMDLDARKFTYRGMFKGGIFGKLGAGLLDNYWPLLVLGIAGAIIAMAFLG